MPSVFNQTLHQLFPAISSLPSGRYIFVSVPAFRNAGAGDCNDLTFAQCHTKISGAGSYEEALFGVPSLIPQLEPIVIVPGIMGSRLNRVSNGQEIWPDAQDMANSASDNYLDALKLDNSGNQISGQEMNVGDIVREATGTYPALPTPFGTLYNEPFDNLVYKLLIDSFTTSSVGYTEGTNLFVAPYDWRFGVASSAVTVGNVIQNAITHSPNGKVNIIAHSMGGLAVKEYLAQTNQTTHLDKVIFAGVPQLGTPLMSKVLQYGDDLGFTAPSGWLKLFGINKEVSVLNPQEAKTITQNMPGTYDLLPSRQYIQAAGGGYVHDFRNGGNKTLNYDQTISFMQNNDSDFNSSLLSGADTLHGQIDNQAINAATVYNIVGCQNPSTITGINLYDNSVYDFERDTGDGTVAAVSAEGSAPNISSYFFLNSEISIDHIGLINNLASVNLIHAIVDNTTGTLFQVGLSTSQNDCQNTPSALQGTVTTQEWSTHSPVTLNIYDAQNRHTGPTVNGDIELGIPGSDYQMIGDNSFILLPASGTFQIVVQGLSAGSFTLKHKDYSGSSLIQAATYVQVPLASASTTATLTISSSTQNPALFLDVFGNGTVVQTIQPTAVLSASSSADITPPTITMPNIATSTILGAPISFSYSVADDLSGVATSSATLDGSIVANGTTLSNLAVGPHTYQVKAIDNAGNPRIQTISFIVIYSFGGFLPPIKADGSGLYNLGRTLPVKFQLTNASGNFISTATAQLFVAKIQDNTVGTDQIALSTGSADTGNTFRYDSTSTQYIFNFDTTPLTAGTWQLKATLDDGISRAVLISLH